jgi:xanthine dehydrogenase accessory factor
MSEQELMQLAQSLNERDEPYAMVTVVRVGAPTSAYVGAHAIIRRDGTLCGWIGGACASEIVIAAAVEAIATGKPMLVRIANDVRQPEPDLLQRAMACSSDGMIELFVQPYGAGTSLCVLGDTPAADEARFFARRLGIRLVDSVKQAAVALLATQGADDALALEAALASPAQHVLMIASHRKAERLREVMRMRGVNEDRLAQLQAPAGQDAGARTPSEIALVAIAGVLALLRGKGASQVERIEQRSAEAATRGAPTTPAATGAAPHGRQSGTFINPVCGMAVSTAAALHVEQYDGEDYYFCCDGCLKTFRQEPARYAAIRRAATSVASP